MTPFLKVANLTKAYSSSNQALSQVSFEISNGEILDLLGNLDLEKHNI